MRNRILGNKMLAKTLAFCLVLALLLLTACDNSGGKASSEEEESTATESTSESKTGGDVVVTPPAKSSMEMYEDFLAGKEKLYVDRVSYTYYDFVADEEYDYFANKDGYYFRDFIATIQNMEDLEPDNDIRVGGTYYTYIDCGDDGEQELALYVYLSQSDWYDSSYLFMIKNIDGKLQLCYREEDGYNSSFYLDNEYGLIYEGWYGGMQYGDTYGYLDANCEYHFLYSCTGEYAFGTEYDWADGVQGAASAICDREGDMNLFDRATLLTYRFKQYEEGENESEVLFYSYDYYNWVYDEETGEGYSTEEPDADLKALIEEAFATAGVKYYTKAQINDMIAKKYDDEHWTANQKNTEDSYVEYTQMTRDEYWPGNIVTVKTADEFMKAIADNTIIYLEPGEYDLTHWLVEEAGDVPRYLSGDYSGENPTGVLYTGWDSDSYEIDIFDVQNLVIASKDPENPATIVSSCPIACVMRFIHCKYLRVENVVMGHIIEPGYCSGNVVCLEQSKGATLEGCDLYGCGAYGVEIVDGDMTYVNNCVIHDCTYGCMTSSRAGDVYINQTKFENCQEFDMFDVIGGSFYFEGCSFKNLYGNMVYIAGDYSYAGFYDCLFDAPALESLQNNPHYGNTVCVY